MAQVFALMAGSVETNTITLRTFPRFGGMLGIDCPFDEQARTPRSRTGGLGSIASSPYRWMPKMGSKRTTAAQRRPTEPEIAKRAFVIAG
jgi:hypothetical protein